MNCIYFKKRTKKYELYFFCSKQRKNITFEDCKKCPYKEYKKSYQIKNKSNKLKNLESKRYSILTDNYNKCYRCPNPKKHTHEIYGGRNRKVSMIHGFTIPLCDECHRKTEEDMDFDKEFKIECQIEYMKTHTEDEFIALTGKSYIAEERR